MRRIICAVVLWAYLFVEGDEHDHLYRDGEEIVLWMNTIGPYSNRQETYAYFSLPFCRGPKHSIGHYHETLGEALLGVELDYSGLDIKFKENVEKMEFCKKTLSEEDYKQFVYAVRNNYWYQMYLDELPMYDIRVSLTPGASIPFTYEVVWKTSGVDFDKRFEKYLDPTFFQHRIHWFSIFNSFMMVIFLVGLVWMILMRTLRKDYARYQKDEDLDDMVRDLGDEYGWKQVHGDVFRTPSFPMLFSSLVGTGYHVFTVVIITIILAIIGEFYTERGSLLSAAIFVYAAASPVNGFAGGSMYARFGGKQWIRQMVFGAFLLPCLVSSVAFLINIVAISYHASRAIPFTIMLAVTAICLFVILPLTLVGTVLGRNVKGQSDNPCRINAVPRPIPDKKWFLEPSLIILLGGVLPFGSIFIEMYFIFTSFWAYKIYYVYGFMLLVTLILAIVTMCVTIVCTYFLLNAEDYRWMYGLFQIVFYFGYMGLFSAALGLMCGTIGYWGAAKFIHKIYSTVKID
ncbi:Transmembrane 9 superfamily member 3 [Dirofilaria immitis]|nr:Transmembrane 9 superfamily member 3 [Dirofilaria immitis]